MSTKTECDKCGDKTMATNNSTPLQSVDYYYNVCNKIFFIGDLCAECGRNFTSDCRKLAEQYGLEEKGIFTHSAQAPRGSCTNV
ncbi:hypothetical protein LCGC14_0219950 [marine sediment metagenome]|uniref:Uncharacterized protein n=1 Tax=marine sediment metagenome TaxID=412755 RepID=A0A0F9UD65_9ZZZZ